MTALHAFAEEWALWTTVVLNTWLLFSGLTFLVLVLSGKQESSPILRKSGAAVLTGLISTGWVLIFAYGQFARAQKLSTSWLLPAELTFFCIFGIGIFVMAARMVSKDD